MFTDSDDSEADYQLQEMIMNPDPRDVEGEERDQPKMDLRMDHLPPPEVRECLDGRGAWQSANTGPKGVKLDYEEAKLHMATERMRNEMRGDRRMQDQALGQKTQYYKEAIPIEEQLKMEKDAKKAKDSDDSDSDSDLTDDSEDENFKKYKLEQIKMVQNSLPSFGTYERMTNEQFAFAIKNTHELCFIVAHIYENHVAHCARLHLCFESLAAQFPQIRFVRIKSTHAMKRFQNAGLPSIMLYRGQKMVDSFVRVHEEIGKITDITVSHWLSKKGVLVMPGNEFFDRPNPNKEPQKSYDSGDSDDQDY